MKKESNRGRKKKGVREQDKEREEIKREENERCRKLSKE